MACVVCPEQFSPEYEKLCGAIEQTVNQPVYTETPIKTVPDEPDFIPSFQDNNDAASLEDMSDESDLSESDDYSDLYDMPEESIYDNSIYDSSYNVDNSLISDQPKRRFKPYQANQIEQDKIRIRTIRP